MIVSWTRLILVSGSMIKGMARALFAAKTRATYTKANGNAVKKAVKDKRSLLPENTMEAG
jgi:CRISPR/Cas system CSM-associated protein Csm3 (group 7 of RAMP superfamily)